MLESFLISLYSKGSYRGSESRKVIKILLDELSGISLPCRTPRSAFAINDVGVSVCYTDPPNRGVLSHLQTYTSFLAGKARGVLHPLVIPRQS